jgi:AcrR family transcriptional regulator
METREKRVKYNKEFRQEILDAARDLFVLFVNEGYERFSMRKLAEKMGYSPTTIYPYFKNRDALFFAMCEEVAEHFFAHLTNIKTAHDDPLEALHQALFYLIAFGFNHPNEYTVFFITNRKVYGNFEEFMEKESMARNSYIAFREIVRDCLATGKLQEIDIDVLTQALIVAIHGSSALSIYKASYPWVDRNVLAHTLVEGLLRGLRR